MNRSILAAVGLTLIAACTRYPARPGEAPITSRSTPRDRYEAELVNSDDVSAARVEAWQAAGRRSLRERLVIRPSFREIVRFAPEHSYAIGYRLALKRGQKVTVAVEPVMGPRGRLFVEVFEEMNPPSAMFLHRYSPHADASGFEYEARSEGDYVIRIQPELNLAGTYRIAITTTAGLTFPVAYANLKSIGSFFGDSRDGGRRDHEGVDIFAPRGTAVVAAAAGVITAVRTTPIGGRVVWHRDDERGVTYYYAHLQEQHVHEGQRVMAGDRIGTVGNTGNARTTPPHLHFAVYRPGQIALDPVPFLYDQPGDTPTPVLVDTRKLGSWAQINSTTRLRAAPTSEARVLRDLGRHTRVLPIGGVRDWQRVMLEDGTTGFISGRLVD